MGAFLPAMTQRMLTGVYHLDNVGFSSVSVVTTAAPVTAFRGAGRPEAAVAIERAMDRFAAEIGMDPAEVRRRNLVPRFLEGYTTGIGTFYDVGDYPEALRRVLEQRRLRRAAGPSRPARRAEGGAVQLGIGLSAYVEITAGGPSSEYGSVELLADGRIKVTSGATPFGQGHDTVWSMIVADRTGVAMDDVEVVHGDTDLVPVGGLTVGSRSVQLAGAAVADASHKLVEAARQEVAELLEAAADDVVLDPAGRRVPRRRDAEPLRGLGRPGRAVARAAVRRVGLQRVDADVPLRRPRRGGRGRHRHRPGPPASATWPWTTPARCSTRCWPRARCTADSPRASRRRCSRPSASTRTATR